MANSKPEGYMHMFKFAKNVHDLIRSFADIPIAEIDEMITMAQSRTYQKGEWFMQQGDPATSVGFVQEGLFKAYSTSIQGSTHIRNFCSQGYFIGSYAAAIQNTPADMTIEAIENSTVLLINYHDLESFFERSSAWQKLARVLAEIHYIEREVKEFRLPSLSALERYQLFLLENKHLAGRISQIDVASYISVAPESLSRLLKAKKS